MSYNGQYTKPRKNARKARALIHTMDISNKAAESFSAVLNERQILRLKRRQNTSRMIAKVNSVDTNL